MFSVRKTKKTAKRTMAKVSRNIRIILRLHGGNKHKYSAIMTLTKDHMRNAITSAVNRGPIVGCRHIQVVLLFLLLLITYTMRVALSVAVVAMTDPHASSNPKIPTYNWTNQNVILSSLGWGYIVLQFIAGQLCKKYGVKWILFGSMMLNSIFCVLIPPAAQWFDYTGVIVCRVIQGLFQGFFFPAVSDILSKWLPLQERARMGTFVYIGTSLGTTVGMVSTGFLSAGDWGWPGAFYIFGIAGVLWSFLWILMGCGDPSHYSRISQEELKYIESNLGCQKRNCKDIPTPYKKILTSIPVIVLIITGVGNLWGCSMLFNDMPLYLQGVMNFDIKSNSILSAAPYLAVLLFNTFFSWVADLLLNKKVLSITNVRKLFTTIGMIGPAISLIILAYVPGQTVLCIILLVLTMGINSASNSGIFVNTMDLSPNHSAVVMGICNGFITLSSILAPLMVQAVVTDNSNTEQWKITFLVSAAFFIAPNILYIFFASAKVQPWNEGKISQEQEEVEADCRRRTTPHIIVIDVEVPLE